MNEQLGLRNTDRGLRNEDNETTAGSATPPYPVVMPHRGVSEFLNVAWASSPCLKFLFPLLLSFWAMPAMTLAQDETLPPPPPPVELLPPESYTFSMMLKPGTDCTVSVLPKGSGGLKTTRSKKAISAEDATGDSGTGSMKVERSFRNGISQAKETAPDGTEEVFYFVGGMCVYENPRKGINVRRFPPGHELSNIGTYHFPELLWAIPETLQSELGSKSAKPPVRLYKIEDQNLTLEVDAVTGHPLRLDDGQMEWRYSYIQSAKPIVLPVNLRKALPAQVHD